MLQEGLGARSMQGAAATVWVSQEENHGRRLHGDLQHCKRRLKTWLAGLEKGRLKGDTAVSCCETRGAFSMPSDAHRGSQSPLPDSQQQQGRAAIEGTNHFPTLTVQQGSPSSVKQSPSSERAFFPNARSVPSTSSNPRSAGSHFLARCCPFSCQHCIKTSSCLRSQRASPSPRGCHSRGETPAELCSTLGGRAAPSGRGAKRPKHHWTSRQMVCFFPAAANGNPRLLPAGNASSKSEG